MENNKKNLCQKALISRILTLEIEPGAMLDETALSNEYGLSRTPLREVFQRLAGEGYLTLMQNRGAKVSSMDLESMRNFFQAAGMIYASIARLAAENSTSGQIIKLSQIQKRFKNSFKTDNASATALLNHEFHAYMGEIAANPYLTPSYNRLLIDHTRIRQRFYRPASPRDEARIDTASQQHDDLIEAISDHATGEAVQITLEHWALTKNRIEHFVHPDPLSHDIDEIPEGSDK